MSGKNIEKKNEKYSYQNKETIETSLQISGLDCMDCAAKLECRLNNLAGIRDVELNFTAARLTVEHSGQLDDVIRVVKEAGYDARIVTDDVEITGGDQLLKLKIIYTVLSGVFLIIAFLSDYFVVSKSAAVYFYLVSMAIGGYHVVRSGLYAIRALSLDMNFLMAVAAVGAVFIGEWAEGASAIFLFSLGNLLQAITMERTRKSVRSLMASTPKEAIVKRHGGLQKLPVAQVQIGDLMIIKAGEAIALDGVVKKGSAHVNQAAITGESWPVLKSQDNPIFAGSICQDGYLEIEATKEFKDSTINKIIHLIEEAQAQKAPAQQFVEVFAKYYTPAVVLLAVLVAFIPTLFWGEPFIPWLRKALILLVISCPCALVISTPVAIIAGIGKAAKKGILIKGGAHLEKIGAIQALAFDKTGTLTTGRPVVRKIIPLIDKSEDDILQVAFSLEYYSDHPVARAILVTAGKRKIDLLPVESFSVVQSRGVSGLVNGEELFIGSSVYFEELGLLVKEQVALIAKLEVTGQTVVLLGSSEKIWAVIGISDELRPSGREVISTLKNLGIGHVIMLTGDSQTTAQNLAGEIGIDEVKAELLPVNKLTVVRELQATYGKVAMVGDGINDGPALAQADVGIAMGTGGTDVALETADVVLISNDLTKIAQAMKLGRRALRIIKENIVFSIAIKVVFIGLTFMGLANMWMAVFADTGATLLVIANGLRLTRD